VWSENLIGGSSQTFQLLETIEIIADRKSTVLITGETGTGKEVVARAIHQRSNRSHRPMITVNCAALPETLLESELFGNTKGAFTGANAHRVGYVEKANGGTLFLDEIGDMPLETQAKLLRLLQEREFQRIGSPEPIPVDIRVIAATNVDLRRAIVEKRFRSDLFFRLNVIPINLSPLRERLSEIPQLVDHFIAKTCRHEGIVEKVADNDAISSLREYSWPGNVRQLEHAVEMAVVLSGQREVLTRKDFQAVLVAEDSLEVDPSLGEAQIPNDGMDFNHTLIVFQRALMDAAMRKAAGNQSRAAQLLGMKRTTMISRYKALTTAAAS
jgi:transcriptional regulator with GAF, ATPase, and Fis domain